MMTLRRRVPQACSKSISARHENSSRIAFQKFLVTTFGQPSRSSDMRIVCLFGARGLEERIDAQNKLRCLFPGRALFSRVEQSQVGRRVGAVIVGEVRSQGSAVCDCGSARRAHDADVPRLALWFVDILARNIAETYQMRRECGNMFVERQR